MRMPTQRVVALVREAVGQARIQGALRGFASVVPCARTADIWTALAEGPARAVVVPAYGPDVPDIIATMRALRARYPSVPVLVYYDPLYTNPRDLLALFQAGAAEIIHSGTDDLRRLFTSVLASAGQRVAARRLLDALTPVLPPQTQHLMRFLLEEADAPMSIEEAATAVGLSRRTLERRLDALGYPAPETLIGWCRLLLAAHLLEDQARTFDEVALQLSFPSGMALRAMLKRYTGVTPRHARDGHGPVAIVLRELTKKLKTPQAMAAIRKSRKTAPGAASASQTPA